MQLLVISDTHGRFDILRKVILSHETADLIVHCGDGEYETERLLDEHPELEPRLIEVRGNCDHSARLPLLRVLPLPFGHRAVITHGHRYMYGDFQENLLHLAREQEADLVLFGHLHVRIDRYIDGIRLFNPGSASLPRDQFEKGYGLVDITEGGILTSHGDISRISLG